MKDQVYVKIRECLEIASKRFNRTFAFPNIEFSLKGTTGGIWYPNQYTMKLNDVLLRENGQKYIDEVVVHETAHLIDIAVYGVQRTPKGSFVQHGRTWKNVMRMLGNDPKRCHKFDVTNARARIHKRNHVYKCGCKTHKLTARKHNSIQKSAAYYGRITHKCRTCNDSIVYMGQKQS